MLAELAFGVPSLAWYLPGSASFSMYCQPSAPVKIKLDERPAAGTPFSLRGETQALLELPLAGVAGVERS